MTMRGAGPCRTIQKIAGRSNDLSTRESITKALNELGFMFEVIPLELQDPAEELISQLRTRYQQLPVE